MFLRKRIEGIAQLDRRERFEGLDLGGLEADLRVRGGLGQLPVLDGVTGGPLGRALGLAVAGDIGVGEDPVQPGLDVGAGLVLVKLLVGLEIGLLDQVLRVGSVAGHAQRRSEKLIHEGHRFVHEARLEHRVVLHGRGRGRIGRKLRR